MKRLLAATLALLAWAGMAGIAGAAGAAISIPANTWVKQPAPTQVGLPGFTGTFDPRGWSHVVYDPNGQRMILWDGYLDASRPYSIYANALWFYDVVNNRLSLETVTNWAWNGSTTVPLAANTTTPTPYDRHSYAGIELAPDQNRLYLWAGANSHISTNWQGDSWRYDLSTHSWSEVNTTGPPYAVYEQTMVYDPVHHRMVVVGGAPGGYQDGTLTYLLDTGTLAWADASAVGQPGPRVEQSMVYDPVRRVCWMFGGGYPYGTPGNELWRYDPAANTWQQITPSGAVPPVRNFGEMAYDSQHDIVLLWGGEQNGSTALSDTWVFRPATQQWQQLTPATSPPGAFDYAENLAYDPVNNVFVLHQAGDFWLYRYAASTDSIPPAAVRDMVAH